MLRNMLINSTAHSNYCPPGLADTENTGGRVTRALWRNDVSVDSMYPLEVLLRGYNIFYIS